MPKAELVLCVREDLTEGIDLGHVLVCERENWRDRPLLPEIFQELADVSLFCTCLAFFR